MNQPASPYLAPSANHVLARAPNCATSSDMKAPRREQYWFAMLCFLAATGCNQNALPVHDSDSFKSAPLELKSIWQTAVVSAKTNGYLCAYTNLQTLQARAGLTAEQNKAIEDLLGVVGTRMFNAANQGDPEATKALKQVQAAAKRR